MRIGKGGDILWDGVFPVDIKEFCDCAEAAYKLNYVSDEQFAQEEADKSDVNNYIARQLTIPTQIANDLGGNIRESDMEIAPRYNNPGKPDCLGA